MSECVVRMEMPKGCLDCPCVNGEYGYCQADKDERQIEDPNERPSWCPIIAASPWHRVEDELPKEKNWVLVWHTGYATPKKAKFIVDVIPEFLFDGGGGAWELDGWSDNKGKVTHWMPLPEPPKENE